MAQSVIPVRLPTACQWDVIPEHGSILSVIISFVVFFTFGQYFQHSRNSHLSNFYGLETTTGLGRRGFRSRCYGSLSGGEANY